MAGLASVLKDGRNIFGEGDLALRHGRDHEKAGNTANSSHRATSDQQFLEARSLNEWCQAPEHLTKQKGSEVLPSEPSDVSEDRSECQFQTELRLTGYVRETAASHLRSDRGARGGEAGWSATEGSGGAAVRARVDDRSARDREVGMVEDVKNLGSELE